MRYEVKNELVDSATRIQLGSDHDYSHWCSKCLCIKSRD
ncbi:Uncharacterised protein [Vibrio cholerae]|nr:Uncharacterised protein [Vibrio cholerae]